MIFYLILPFLISVGVIPLLIYFSKKKNLLDFAENDPLKIHKQPVSVLGGAAMFLGVAVPFLFLGYFDVRFIFIFLGCAVVFLLGLWDDLNWKHISNRKPYFKFFLLITCSLVAAYTLYLSGFKSYLLLFLAFIYIFILINAVNYQDGMDGQAGVLVFISLMGFLVLSIVSGNNFSLKILLALMGAVFGFLIYNFPPAKIFMGDSGAYLLGFMLAALAVNFSGNILSAALIIGLPLFDGVYSNARRILDGRSIFLGDREHFYDKMIKRGFSVRRTLLISGALQAFIAAIGVLIFIYA